MNLNFDSGKSQYNNYCKAYYPNWDYSKNGGCYEKGVDFLSVHWEITNNKNNVIKLHVESPKYQIDSNLSMIKHKIIILLLAELYKMDINNFFEENNIGVFKISSTLPGSDKNKCTEVFQIVLSNPLSTSDENISLVDRIFKNVINSVLSKVQEMIDSENLLPSKK